jgi:hypothetical protein
MQDSLQHQLGPTLRCHCSSLGSLVQQTKEVALDLQALNDGLNDQIGILNSLGAALSAQPLVDYKS